MEATRDRKFCNRQTYRDFNGQQYFATSKNGNFYPSAEILENYGQIGDFRVYLVNFKRWKVG